MRHFRFLLSWQLIGVLAFTGFALLAPGPSADAAPAAPPRCTAANLGAWIAPARGQGAAGTVYYPLQLTNLGRSACSLAGFPGVSAVTRTGTQLGSPAARSVAGSRARVIIGAGGTAHAILAYHDVAVSTAPGCRPVGTAAALKVYPPGSTTATEALVSAVVFSEGACSRAGVAYLGVSPVQPGPG